MQCPGLYGYRFITTIIWSSSHTTRESTSGLRSKIAHKMQSTFGRAAPWTYFNLPSEIRFSENKLLSFSGSPSSGSAGSLKRIHLTSRERNLDRPVLHSHQTRHLPK